MQHEICLARFFTNLINSNHNFPRWNELAEESVYKYIELTGVSGKSWEQAINNAITKAATSLLDLRVAEVITQDVRIEGNKIAEYRVRLKLSFKYEKE